MCPRAEHILSIVCHLLQGLGASDALRVLNKFIENDFEKVDRVIELYAKYSRRMRSVEKRQQSMAFADMSEEDRCVSVCFGVCVCLSVCFRL